MTTTPVPPETDPLTDRIDETDTRDETVVPPELQRKIMVLFEPEAFERIVDALPPDPSADPGPVGVLKMWGLLHGLYRYPQDRMGAASLSSRRTDWILLSIDRELERKAARKAKTTTTTPPSTPTSS